MFQTRGAPPRGPATSTHNRQAETSELTADDTLAHISHHTRSPRSLTSGVRTHRTVSRQYRSRLSLDQNTFTIHDHDTQRRATEYRATRTSRRPFSVISFGSSLTCRGEPFSVRPPAAWLHLPASSRTQTRTLFSAPSLDHRTHTRTHTIAARMEYFDLELVDAGGYSHPRREECDRMQSDHHSWE